MLSDTQKPHQGSRLNFGIFFSLVHQFGAPIFPTTLHVTQHFYMVTILFNYCHTFIKTWKLYTYKHKALIVGTF